MWENYFLGDLNYTYFKDGSQLATQWKFGVSGGKK